MICSSIHRSGSTLNFQLSTMKFIEIRSALVMLVIDLSMLLTFAALGLWVILHAGAE
jgi:hypothetical protein